MRGASRVFFYILWGVYMLVMNAYSINILLPLCSGCLSVLLMNYQWVWEIYIHHARIAFYSALNNQQYAHDTLWILSVQSWATVVFWTLGTLLIQFKDSCLNSLVLFTDMRRNSTPSNDYICLWGFILCIYTKSIIMEKINYQWNVKLLSIYQSRL
jgi:hypothetical protein